MKTHTLSLIAKSGLLVAVLVAVASISPMTAFAAVTVDDGGGAGNVALKNVICDPAKAATLKRMSTEGVDLHGTVGLVEDYLLNKNITIVSFGLSGAQIHGCGSYISRQMPQGSFSEAIAAQGCNSTPNEICAGYLNQQFEADNGRYDGQKFATSQVAGSLLGYANLAQNTLKYEPVPVNLAYFFNDYLAKVPVLGERAYAQSVDYQSTLINKVLTVWKIFRNIAYALMSLIMLWVGFAIITRRKINAQTVVNVQYALPKIVIALVMIAFSYPIGALITSFSWTLWHSSDTIVKSLSGVAGGAGDIVDSIKNMGVGGVIAAFSILNAAVSGGGAALGLIALSNLVTLVMFLFVYFKAMWIYIKMVMHTALAPLQMALYALPGNDHLLEEWFKKMLAMGAGIFGMKIVMDLTQVFVWTMLRDGFTVNTTGAGVAGFFKAAQAIESGSLFAVWITPLILIFGFASAGRVPSIIEGMLLEKKRK